MSAGIATALVGYAVAAPFVLWIPLFKRMWHAPDARLLVLHETGVVLIVVGLAAQGRTPAAAVNAAYGVGVGLARVLARR